MTNTVPLIPIAEHQDRVLDIFNQHVYAMQTAFFELAMDAMRDTANTPRKLETTLRVLRGSLTTMTVSTAWHLLPNIADCRPLVITQLAKIQQACMDLLKELEQGTFTPAVTAIYDMKTGKKVEDYAFDFRDMMRGQG